MSVTIKDVAKLANVSVGTASLAINGKEGVKEKTKAKVLEAAKRLNYSPNHFARSLIMNRSLTIGLIISDITNPFFGTVVSYVQKAVEGAGYNLLLGISNDVISKEKTIVDYFISRNVEGLIIVPSADKEADLGHLYNLKRLGIPFVFITTFYEQIKADCVMTDLRAGSYQLTKFLIENGNDKIYIISGYSKAILSSLRIDGYIDAYKELKKEYRNEWIFETYTDFTSGYTAAEKILEKDRPDAIIAINDIMALGVLKCLKDKNLKVPNDISVAGYDDLLFASIVETPLTTISQPISDICQKAVDILLHRIRKEEYPEDRIFLQPKLVIRNSTKFING